MQMSLELLIILRCSVTCISMDMMTHGDRDNKRNSAKRAPAQFTKLRPKVTSGLWGLTNRRTTKRRPPKTAITWRPKEGNQDIVLVMRLP
ncbi:hypothetical protein Bpfe_019799 [Biomphalaria pfeifferi]|uniref:Secreted protein n=1 Tax=Biomphalaria pfeifferi TaxID=112525 RepID=A0AAD8F461_BIOPF|nr:hypothetical protein Bpfe_019799 [Biomphalaria pfeifferi]